MGVAIQAAKTYFVAEVAWGGHSGGVAIQAGGGGLLRLRPDAVAGSSQEPELPRVPHGAPRAAPERLGPA